MCCHDVIPGFVLYLVPIVALARERLWVVIQGRRRVRIGELYPLLCAP
jgi:hypothetical protein